MALCRKLLAEFLGTALLLACVVGSGIMGVNLAGGNDAIALLANAGATAGILYVLITVFGPVSGAHFNPAVTLVMRMRGELRTHEALAYVGVQVVAAVAGVLLAHAMFDLATLQPGTRVPAYCTANGRVLTAWLPEPEREAWLARQTMAARTVQTLTDRDRLREELARVRAQGHALVDQEFEPGLRTVAVPLRNRRGEVVASMNVSVHAARVSIPDLLDRCLPMLLQAQEQLKPLL